MGKVIRIDKGADKEIKRFPSPVQAKVKTYLFILGRDGQLAEPYAKKISKNLYEIRVRYQGQWRVIYAYLVDDYIIVLSAFQKKTNKTPKSEILKAQSRMKWYI